jgi:hypothetical protein
LALKFLSISVTDEGDRVGIDEIAVFVGAYKAVVHKAEVT